MNALRILPLAFAMTLCACASSSPAPSAKPAEPGDAAAQFARMKSLEGHWVSTTTAPAEDGGGRMAVDYNVVAAGSALTERLFPGTVHEMVTMYYVDGGELVMTHYCAMGNQPHMRARARNDGALVFTCDGSTLDCKNDPHMHEGVFTMIDRDHLRSEWTSRNSPEHESMTIELVRATGS